MCQINVVTLAKNDGCIISRDEDRLGINCRFPFPPGFLNTTCPLTSTSLPADELYGTIPIDMCPVKDCIARHLKELYGDTFKAVIIGCVSRPEQEGIYILPEGVLSQTWKEAAQRGMNTITGTREV